MVQFPFLEVDLSVTYGADVGTALQFMELTKKWIDLHPYTE